MDWQDSRNYLVGTLNCINCPKNFRIAGFDFEDTLKKPKMMRGKFVLKHDNIVEKFKEYIKKGFMIVIFTNGTHIANPQSIKKWEERFTNFINSIKTQFPDNFYLAVYVALQDDLYKKPNIGMWKLMKENLKVQFENKELHISKKSFFVGSAAGRCKTKNHEADLHGFDRKFALNIGIDFYTPEEFFFDKKKEKYQITSFSIPAVTQKPEKFKKRKKEMIIMCGLPNSGKSTYCKKYIFPKGYVYIDDNILRIVGVRDLRNMMDNKQKIIIDCNILTVGGRKKYINVAKEKNYFIRFIYMNTDIELCKHLNNVRHLVSDGAIPKIPLSVYTNFSKKFIKPTLQEGFDSVEEINFNYDPDFLKDKKWVKSFNILSET